MRKVRIVVVVLIINCQVSRFPKRGYEAAQRTTRMTPKKKNGALAMADATQSAKRSKNEAGSRSEGSIIIYVAKIREKERLDALRGLVLSCGENRKDSMADFSSLTDDELAVLQTAMCAGFAEGALDSRNPVHDLLDLELWRESQRRKRDHTE
jgi:hypothetical protein